MAVVWGGSSPSPPTAAFLVTLISPLLGSCTLAWSFMLGLAKSGGSVYLVYMNSFSSSRPVQEIIEFPILKLNGRTMEIESTFHMYVQPVVHPQLTPFCTEVKCKGSPVLWVPRGAGFHCTRVGAPCSQCPASCWGSSYEEGDLLMSL